MPTRSNGETSADLCPMCRTGRVEVVQRTAEHFDGAVRVSFADELSKCGSCAEEFYTYEQSQAHSRALATALRKAHGLPSPERIREVRVGLAMTQAQFEQAMGVGPKTVGRWERGTVVPGSAARGMLWFAQHHPGAFLEYARERGAVARHAAQGAPVIAHILAARSGDAKPMVLRPDREQVVVREGTTRGDTNQIQLVDAPDKERAV